MIKVIGLGDAGCRCVNGVARWHERHPHTLRTIALNTHPQWEADLRVDMAYVFEESGLGTGGNPMLGRQIAEDNKDFLFDLLSGADKIILTAGMGGGTGTGSAHVVAYVAKELNIPCIPVVTMPLDFEGSQRKQIAELGVQALRKFTDDVIVISADAIEQRAQENVSPQLKGISLPLATYYETASYLVLEKILNIIQSDTA